MQITNAILINGHNRLKLLAYDCSILNFPMIKPSLEFSKKEGDLPLIIYDGKIATYFYKTKKPINMNNWILKVNGIFFDDYKYFKAPIKITEFICKKVE